MDGGWMDMCTCELEGSGHARFICAVQGGVVLVPVCYGLPVSGVDDSGIDVVDKHEGRHSRAEISWRVRRVYGCG